MGRRNVLKHVKLLDSETIDSNKTSDKVGVENLDQASIIVEWSAGSTPIGTITVEGSNSTDDEFAQGNETWCVLDFGVAINISGNSGCDQLIFNLMPFRYLRIKYNRSSGSATMTAAFHAENIGA